MASTTGIIFVILVQSVVLSLSETSTLPPTPDKENESTPTPTPTAWPPEAHDIVMKDRLASVLYKFTKEHNIFKPKDSGVDCIKQMIANKNLVGPYMINTTLNSSLKYITDTFNEMYRNVKGRDVKFAMTLQHLITKLLNDQEPYFSAVTEIVGNTCHLEYICQYNSSCACVSNALIDEYKHELWVINESYSDLHEFVLFGRYLEPIFRLVAMAVGLFLNLTVLHTFMTEKNVQNENYIMVLMMAVNNLVILLAYIPLNYMNKFQSLQEGVSIGYIFIEIMVVSANALIVLSLSVQRYFDVIRELTVDTNRRRRSPVTKCLLYATATWFWSTAVAFMITQVDPSIINGLVILLCFLIYILFLSVLLAVFNALTAKEIQRAAERDRTASGLDHIVSSGLVFGLTVLFYFVHTPFFLFLVLETVEGMRQNYFVFTWYRVVHLLIHFSFNLLPTASVVILYKTTSEFKKSFQKHFCGEPDERQRLTMTYLRPVE